MTKQFIWLVCLALANTGCFGQDTLNGKVYTKVKDYFYTDTAGSLYFKNTAPQDDGKHVISYRLTMPLTSWETEDTLKRVIDLPTYMSFPGTPYAKDKRHVYYFISNSDGKHMRILKEADVITFKIVKGKKYDAQDIHRKYLEANTVDENGNTIKRTKPLK
jgi:hypothetical protein